MDHCDIPRSTATSHLSQSSGTVSTADNEDDDVLLSALPHANATPFFKYHMQAAMALGLTRKQALGYISNKRRQNGALVIAVLRRLKERPHVV